MATLTSKGQVTIPKRIREALWVEAGDRVDFTLEAVARYRAGGGDFSDHLIGLRNQRAGCDRTLTFDRRLHRAPAFASLW